MQNQTNAARPSGTPQRPLPAIARRVLIIGLDGATFDVLDPLMREGRMPRLAEAIAAGTRGVLQSTTPPITPAAWTTFLTGKQPGRHGIIDFERYEPTTNRLVFNSTRCLDHVRNIWDLLGTAGFKVGSINVPMTYPPTPVNGFMVSGFETPGPGSEFVYPPDLREEILQRWPDPTLRAKWRRKTFGGEGIFRRNLDYIRGSFDQGAEMTEWLGERFGWDALMVVFKLVDNLQHKTWKYIDPRWADRRPGRRDLVKECFEYLDVAVGRLLDYARKHEASVLMVSDHGHGSLEGKVQPNLLLRQWGYLALGSGAARSATRARRVGDRMAGRSPKRQRVDDIARDLAVDFERTQACVMHAGMAGFLYLNLEGRQPTGIVAATHFESLRDELRERFLGPECRAVDPAGRPIQLFTEVHKPEELYNCSREEQPWLPDLMLIPHPSLAVIRKIRGRRPVRWLPKRRIEGTHRPEGILIACGPGIRQGGRADAHIADCAPTVLAMLGQRIPADMDGQVITGLFAESPVIEKSAAVAAVQQKPESDEVFTEEELQRVTERLTNLGYLE